MSGVSSGRPVGVAERLEAVVGPVCRGLTWVAAGCLAAMGVITVVDVLGRYFLNRPVPGALEVSEFTLALLVYLALGATGLSGRQVVVDLAVGQMPPRVRAGSQAFGALLGIGFWGLVAWRTALHARHLADKGEVSTILAIPTFPFVYAVAFGSAVLAVALLVRFFAALPRAAAR